MARGSGVCSSVSANRPYIIIHCDAQPVLWSSTLPHHKPQKPSRTCILSAVCTPQGLMFITKAESPVVVVLRCTAAHAISRS